MDRIKCSIIRDLMPSYADGILSEDSKLTVDEHIASCAECRAELELMCSASPIDGSAPDEGAALEIDYLKKNRRFGRRLAGICVAASALIACGLLFLTNYVMGSAGMPAGTDYALSVEGGRVTITGETEEGCAVSRVRFSEKDGVVSIYTSTVKPSLLYGTEFSGSFTSDTEIKRVVLNSRTVWCSVSDNVKQLLEAENSAELSPADARRGQMGLLPNDPSASFASWDEAEAFLGMELWNPFESADGFTRLNYTSSAETAFIPFSEYLAGVPVGYGNNDPTHVCLFLNHEVSGGGTLSEGNGEPWVLGMDIAAGYEVGEAMVSFRAAPIGGLGSRFGCERRELGGKDIAFSRSEFEGGISEELCFERDGVDYQVLVISLTGEDLLESAVERVCETLEAAFAEVECG